MTTTISMTDFAEVVSKSGTTKATKVRQIKEREDYNPATDFYKQLREGIVDLHKKKKDKKELNNLLIGLTDKKKKTNYPDAVKGYQKWLGKKVVTLMPSITSIYSHAGLNISVNPELSLSVNGIPHIIKLYFRGEKLTKSKANVIIALMELALRSKSSKDSVIGILDVRNAKLHLFSDDIKTHEALVKGEMSYIVSVWDTF